MRGWPWTACWPSPGRPPPATDLSSQAGGAPDGEPPREVRLERKLTREQVAHTQLQHVVALLPLRRTERVEGAALVEVDEREPLARRSLVGSRLGPGGRLSSMRQRKA